MLFQGSARKRPAAPTPWLVERIPCRVATGLPVVAASTIDAASWLPKACKTRGRSIPESMR
jgi:hypothetical protein